MVWIPPGQKTLAWRSASDADDPYRHPEAGRRERRPSGLEKVTDEQYGIRADAVTATPAANKDLSAPNLVVW